VSIFNVAGIQLSVAALTDRGLRRPVNEDAFMADGPAFVVADGIGGYERGELASAAVVAAFSAHLSGDHLGEFADVHAALLDADDRVARIAVGTTRGTGSTATGTVLVSHEGQPFWLIFNVGDSRVYRHLGSELTQLTVDHSLGQEMVDAGVMAAGDLATFKDRHLITRAIGANDSLADSWLVPVVNGERLLLCSDGLYGEVDDESIRAVLTMNGRTETVAQVLVDRAKANGGHDNITVVVIDVVSGGDDAHTDDATGSASSANLDDTLQA